MSKPLYPANPVLLVDDEQSLLQSLAIGLAMLGLNNIKTIMDSREVLPFLRESDVEAVVLDMIMPHISGEELLTAMMDDFPDIPVIMLTGIDDVETAVRLMRLNAFDYIVKPAKKEKLAASLKTALKFRALKKQNNILSRQVHSPGVLHPEFFQDTITCDDRMLSLFRYVEAISPGQEPVLVTGETGTGKELVAKSLHRSAKVRGDFVAVNVAGLDDHVFSDTLFGHVKGAFTGADKARPGLADKAAGGTLFLDEIGDLSFASQVKLLRLLQEREYYPLGADRPKNLSARVVVATHKPIDQLSDRDKFRPDLFFRLRTHHVDVPPLRDRSCDIPLLLEHFMAMAAKEFNKPVPTWPSELVALMRAYSFPGNIRELRAMVYDAVSRHEARVMSLQVFKDHIGQPGLVPPAPERAEGVFSGLKTLPSLRESADLLVDEAMRRAQGNQRIAASLLGISHQALNKRLMKRK